MLPLVLTRQSVPARNTTQQWDTKEMIRLKNNSDDSLFRWYTSALMLFVVLDTATTVIGLRIGISELNPLFTTIPALLFFKFNAFVIFALLYRITMNENKQRLGVKFYKYVTVIGITVVVWNTAMIIAKVIGI